MTMQQVLDGITEVAQTQERILKRVKAVEVEVGMEDDDDPDKDPGRSTRTPGQPMTRAQMHRAARDKDKLARSGTYGNIGINPNPGPSRNKYGDSGMNAGNMLRSALTSGSFKDGHRELEYLEERNISFGREGTGGGADPALVANVVTKVLRGRGYIKDSGSIVDMEQLLGAEVGTSND